MQRLLGRGGFGEVYEAVDTNKKPNSGVNGTAVSDVAAQVQQYLDRTDDTYPPDSDVFYARIALSAALSSYRKGNFGLGAVAVVRWGSRVELYHGENGMAKPTAVVDHAETHALLRVAAGETPDQVIDLPQPATDPDNIEVTVYGTVEPCPMCVCALTNAGVTRSVSTCRDGELTREGDYLVSDGAANALGDKYLLQPRVWRQIQQTRGLRFDLLEPVDPELHDLTWRIVIESREQIDRSLATRPPLGIRRKPRRLPPAKPPQS